MQRYPPRMLALSYGYSDNLGDNAILEAVMEHVNARGVKELEVLDFGAPESSVSIPEDLKVRRIPPLNSGKLIASIIRNQVVLLGGGGIIQHNSSFYNLIYFITLSLIVILFRKPLHIYRVGISDIRPRWARLLLRLIFDRASSVSVRDQPSLIRLRQQIGSTASAEVRPDPALDRPYQPNRVQNEVSQLVSDPYILVALRPPIDSNPRRLASRKYTHMALSSAAQAIAPAFDRLQADLANMFKVNRLLFIASQYPRDYEFANHLRSRLQRQDGIFVLNKACSFDDIIFLAKNAECVVSSRFHACIAALKADAPLVALSNFKISALIQEHGKRKGVILLDIAQYHDKENRSNIVGGLKKRAHTTRPT